MDIIRGDGELLKNIDLAPKNAYQEVLQNVAIIIDTWENTCPMMRALGMPAQLIGRPMPVVKNILVGQLYDQIEEHEPRAILGDITFEENALTGKLIPIIEIEGVQLEDEED
ncbi:MAG: hypothetical protein HFI82_13505 [Eubacterium sp.]|jgi:hypothetical protein|nr:hypothetical protein [Eubacterium sp.]